MIHVYEELGESSRRSILSSLCGGPKSVTDLVRATGLKQPNVSNHLARMKSRGVVKAEKVGRQVFYSFASTDIGEIVRSALKNNPEIVQKVDYPELSKVFAKAAMNGDEYQCGEIIETALMRRAPLAEIYENLLRPAMCLIGTWYSVSAIDEAQEHMASEITLRCMSRVVQAVGPVRRINRTVLLGCAENSWHMIGLRMIGDYLRVNGWRTIFLGANVPRTAFIAAVKQHRPDLVLLSCVCQDAVDSTIGLVRELADMRNKRNRYVIGIGGPLVRENPSRYFAAGADFSADSLDDFALRYLPDIERTGRIDDSARSLFKPKS